MKLLKKLLIIALLLAPLQGFAQKIGFVNVTILFNEYAKTKGIDKMLEDKFDQPRKELESLVADIKKLEKEIKTNELMMTESKLKSSTDKLKKMVAEYRQKGVGLEKELQAMRSKEMSEFRKIVFEVTQKYAKENKYELIVNEGVMYAADSINITKEISTRVNKAVK